MYHRLLFSGRLPLPCAAQSTEEGDAAGGSGGPSRPGWSWGEARPAGFRVTDREESGSAQGLRLQKDEAAPPGGGGKVGSSVPGTKPRALGQVVAYTEGRWVRAGCEPEGGPVSPRLSDTTTGETGWGGPAGQSASPRGEERPVEGEERAGRRGNQGSQLSPSWGRVCTRRRGRWGEGQIRSFHGL